MTGKTHRVGGMLGGLVGFSLLKSQGMLVSGVSEPLQLVMLYASSMYGSILSDMDHEWESCPAHDAMSWVLWKVLHLTTPIRRFLSKGGKIRKWLYKKLKIPLEFLDSRHRSWQTHSDLALMLIVWLILNLPKKIGTSIDGMLITIIGEGILFGLISHLFLDMLTTDGIWSFLLAPLKLFMHVDKKDTKEKHVDKKDMKEHLFRLSLVPKGIKFFTTRDSNSPWEKVCRRVMNLFIIIFAVRILYLWSPYRFVIG